MDRPVWIAWDELTRRGECIRCGTALFAGEDERPDDALRRHIADHGGCARDEADRQRAIREQQDVRARLERLRLVEGGGSVALRNGDDPAFLGALLSDPRVMDSVDPLVRATVGRALIALSEVRAHLRIEARKIVSAAAAGVLRSYEDLPIDPRDGSVKPNVKIVSGPLPIDEIVAAMTPFLPALAEAAQNRRDATLQRFLIDDTRVHHAELRPHVILGNGSGHVTNSGVIDPNAQGHVFLTSRKSYPGQLYRVIDVSLTRSWPGCTKGPDPEYDRAFVALEYDDSILVPHSPIAMFQKHLAGACAGRDKWFSIHHGIPFGLRYLNESQIPVRVDGITVVCERMDVDCERCKRPGVLKGTLCDACGEAVRFDHEEAELFAEKERRERRGHPAIAGIAREFGCKSEPEPKPMHPMPSGGGPYRGGP